MKMLFWILLLLVILIVAGAFALGWVMSNRYLVPRPYSLMPEFEITAVDDQDPGEGSAVVTLPVTDEPTQFSQVRKEGIYNLLWEDGYGRLGSVQSDDGERVVRPVTDIIGRPPAANDPARLDVTVYRRDPYLDFGLRFDELMLQGEAGRLYAWWVDAGVNRAVLALHGRRRADRTETLRILPVLFNSGWSVMSLAYRNHDISDPSPDGLFHYGASEAEDALVAVEELQRRGVEEVVLYGFSMGGAVALEAAQRWPTSGPKLLGIVLDSPLLDPREVIRKGARDSGLLLADHIVDLSLAVASLRTGVDWSSLDQRRAAAQVAVPVLLIAGTADETIPIRLVDEFADRVAAPLEYLRLEGVDHVEGWNRDRPRYEAAVSGFLEGVGGHLD